MDNGVFLCIDAGTTRFKAAAVTPGGTIIAKSESFYTSSDESLHEYRTDELVEALTERVSKIKDACTHKTIIGIGITGHGPTLIPINREGKPIFSGIGYLDDRVKKYIQKLVQHKNDKITSTMYIPIALFFKEEVPKIYEKTYKFLQSFDYLAYRLTGNLCSSSSSSGIKPWEREKIEGSGLDMDKFPRIRYMGQEIGRIRETTAKKLGVPEGIPLFAIGVDFAAALVGTNALHRGRACERAGSSGGINLCWDTPISDKRLLCYEHFIENRWNIAGITSTYGKAIDWARQAFPAENFIHERQKRSTPEIIFLPYLKGERTPLWNPYAKGGVFGVNECHDSIDLLTSVYMGIAFSMRDCIEIIEENGCEFPYPIMTTGGGAQDEWFTQLKANVTGKSFATTQLYDAELLGIAIVLAAAMGYYEDLLTAADRIVQEKTIYRPQEEECVKFSKLFQLYRRIGSKLLKHL